MVATPAAAATLCFLGLLAWWCLAPGPFIASTLATGWGTPTGPLVVVVVVMIVVAGIATATTGTATTASAATFAALFFANDNREFGKRVGAIGAGREGFETE